MKTSWTKGLNVEQKEALKTSFYACQDVRQRLAELLNEKKQTSQKTRNSQSGYEVANWAYKQADACGYERALDEILSLILV